MAEKDWDTFLELSANLTLGWSEGEQARRFAEYMRECFTQNFARETYRGIAESDVTDLLPQLEAPTLVLHRREVAFPTVDNARALASRIPNAQLILQEGTALVPFLGDTEAVAEAINEFLGEGKEAAAIAEPAEPGTFRTVLFTDLVAHTEMMSRLGDERGRDVLREHETITREVLKQPAGTEVKTMGDGFMASFSSVTKPVECSIALQRAFAERKSDEPLNVRVGLNAGEPIEEDGDLFGATVILASRIAAKADGGEILVADTIRGLCSGKGFLFADRGEFVAKGFEEPVRLYEVRWRD